MLTLQWFSIECFTYSFIFLLITRKNTYSFHTMFRKFFVGFQFISYYIVWILAYWAALKEAKKILLMILHGNGEAWRCHIEYWLIINFLNMEVSQSHEKIINYSTIFYTFSLFSPCFHFFFINTKLFHIFAFLLKKYETIHNINDSFYL